jgi:hypothetical protein
MIILYSVEESLYTVEGSTARQKEAGPSSARRQRKVVPRTLDFRGYIYTGRYVEFCC